MANDGLNRNGFWPGPFTIFATAEPFNPKGHTGLKSGIRRKKAFRMFELKDQKKEIVDLSIIVGWRAFCQGLSPVHNALTACQVSVTFGFNPVVWLGFKRANKWQIREFIFHSVISITLISKLDLYFS